MYFTLQLPLSLVPSLNTQFKCTFCVQGHWVQLELHSHSFMLWFPTDFSPTTCKADFFYALVYVSLCGRVPSSDQSLRVPLDLYQCHSVPFRISPTASQSPCRLAVYRRKGQGKLSRSQPLRDGETAGETGKSEQGRGDSLSRRKEGKRTVESPISHLLSYWLWAQTVYTLDLGYLPYRFRPFFFWWVSTWQEH